MVDRAWEKEETRRLAIESITIAVRRGKSGWHHLAWIGRGQGCEALLAPCLTTVHSRWFNHAAAVDRPSMIEMTEKTVPASQLPKCSYGCRRGLQRVRKFHVQLRCFSWMTTDWSPGKGYSLSSWRATLDRNGKYTQKADVFRVGS